MQLTVATDDDRIVTLDVDENEQLGTIKAIVEAETGIPASTQRLLYNNRELSEEGGGISAQGVSNGDVVMLISGRQQAAPRTRAADTPEALMDQIRSSPQALAQIAAGNPGLAQAIRAGDLATFTRELQAAAARQRSQQEDVDMLNANLMDPEVQAKIAEQIAQKNIQEALEDAIEHAPEMFGTVIMLYVHMEVNNMPLKAFIDSGAQSTIMSKRVAEKCNILRLLDKRFAGVARGVGSANIPGRVHQAPLKVGEQWVTASITVLDQDDMDFLFGLDMLKRHQCVIDLQKNVLRIGSCNVELPFLAEHELPHLREREAAEWAAVGGTGASDAEGNPSNPGASAASAAAAAGAAAAARAAAASATAPWPLHNPSRPGAAASTPAAQPFAQPQLQQGAGVGRTVQQPAGAAHGVQARGATGSTELSADMQQKVAGLMNLGFDRQQCLEALAACNGNEDHAASLLFG